MEFWVWVNGYLLDLIGITMSIGMILDLFC
jgi:hypothetical protein